MDGISIPASFDSLTFAAGSRHSDHCGSNGLPVTPSSITMIGNFMGHIRSSSRHDHLITYADCFRNRHEKITVVFEHCEEREWGSMTTGERMSELESLVRQMLLALYHLHYERYLTHGNITPSSFVFDGSKYKLKHWPLNFLTENGSLLDSDALFPDDIRFSAPERITHSSRSPPFKSDVWSLSLSLLFLMFPDARLPDNPADIVRLTSSKAVLRRLDVSETDMPDSRWFKFFDQSLEPILSKRSSVKQLLKLFDIPEPVFQFNLIDTLVKHDKLSLKSLTDDSVIPALDMDEIYYLLCLASPGFREAATCSGPNSPSERSNGSSLPPIHTLPILVTLNPLLSSHTSSTVPSPEAYSRFSFIPSESCLISTRGLRDRLRELDPEIFYPLILFPSEGEKKRRTANEHNSLPLVIRENDFAYQTERTILFKALIQGVPYVRSQLVQMAKIDINPFYRCHIWSAILNVTWSQMEEYEKIDKSSITTTDRQISVDIPRCHQYNELLASRAGHAKLTRILKAWLQKNEGQGYVYWQGLDSLAAPFVIVNFSDEGRAFACFHNFINKYLRGFFARDNSDTIQEYLSLFSHLIAFHDPALFNHLDELSFTPELYAIPWFLTMFTHVLPLHKTIHVWDTLLFGNETFPLCIGLAILQQLRTQLLDLSFNDCILIFSDLPEISIDTLVADAIRLFRATPKSATQRDWVPLAQLRSMICPMIAIEDVVDLVTNTKLTLVLVDMRSEELRSEFGTISGAIVTQETDGVMDRVLSTCPSYHLLVVVNNVLVGDQLVRRRVPRTCCLQLDSFIPKELMAQPAQ